MFGINSDYQNLSNYFSYSSDLGNELADLVQKSGESIFGIELVLDKGAMNILTIAPPFIRLQDRNATLTRECPYETFTAYEGYLSRPLFMPLYGGMKGQLLDDLADLSLAEGEKVFMQWLFRRRTHWKTQAIDMYESYLNGNESPSSYRFGRALQDKVLGMLERLSPIEENPYIDEVEDKLQDTGYQFQLRLAIQSPNPHYLENRISTFLERYDAYNALRLQRTRAKHFTEYYRDCRMAAENADQILSTQEILSLMGGVISNPSVVQPVRETTEIIQLLPTYEREESKVEEGLISNLAEALKRVGIIDKARVYNESVTAGIRLVVIQIDIPKSKNLTHITAKAKDIQAAMGVPSLGIEQGDTPDTVRFILPTNKQSAISLRELLELPEYQEFAKENALPFVVGVDEVNNPLYLSLTKLVHLLIAGATGSGKSVFLNTIIVALLTRYTPDLLRFVMIDPKQVELDQYRHFPHVDDVIVDMRLAGGALHGLVKEMERRYTLFRENGVKNITLYNTKMSEPMPYIVCVIEEYAELMDVCSDVEEYIGRLGQKARAAGIHLIITTQRPSADIVSGRIKANIPNAISFNLNNNKNYTTVFGQGLGGLKLLGRGDGVMRIEGYPKEFQRFQSAMISLDETEEESVYKRLAEYYGSSFDSPSEPVTVEEIEVMEEVAHDTDDDISRLKKVIAASKETRVEPLRKELGVKTTKMKDLMSSLVEEGWLIKHKDRSKGYELIASEEELKKWNI